MSKDYIFAFIGKSGSGKTSLARMVKEELKMNEIVSFTTRPKRQREKEGIDYFFITDKEFESLKEKNLLAEESAYNNWHYGIKKETIESIKGNSVVVVELKGLRQLIKLYGDRVVPIYIDTNDKNRLKRSLDREDNPDCKEICRRLIADTEDFANVLEEFKPNIINNNETKAYSLLKILNLIYKYSPFTHLGDFC